MAKGRKKKKSAPNFLSESEDQIVLNPSPQEFLNREIQWLEFNARVLNEAADERNPLLERLRFLMIFSSNLDEFMMKRVGGLKRQVEHGVQVVSNDGLSAPEQLRLIRLKTLALLKDQSDIFKNKIVPALQTHNISFIHWKNLTEKEKAFAKQYFRSHVFPVLTPLAVDPGHPFPFISNLSTSLAITLTHDEDGDEKLFARVKIPKIFPQWLRLNSEAGEGEYRYVSLTEIISAHVADLFPSMKVLSIMPFRITRNADIGRDEDGAEDLLEMIAEEIKQRRFADAIRLEHGPNPDPWMLELLREEMGLGEEDLYELESLLDFSDLKSVADLKIVGLHYETWIPVAPLALSEDSSFFQTVSARDVLVHHPYESFSASVIRFIEEAVRDPQVLAIKMTLYRTGDKSPIVPLLMRAAEAGKQVVCLVELKARFDEARNIVWAQKLENAGVHVVYGIVGLKTHCKTLLVIREEQGSVTSYAHIGTGNYHKETANFYTDLGLFTARPEITHEVVHLFHSLTGHSQKREYTHLLVAPHGMKTRFLAAIEAEIENQRQGLPAQIIAKFNSLEDTEICRALYRASGAGVSIDLIVRGFCCLKPGVPGLSENIRVRSILGRFLEHSRIFYFRNGAQAPEDGDFFIGSADWMYRNLHARVEVIAPLYDKLAKKRVLDILNLHLNDKRQAWLMNPDGSYVQLKGDQELENFGSQTLLMREYLQAAHEKLGYGLNII